LRQCVAHVFPERVDGVLAFDVPADASAQESLTAARQAVTAKFAGAPVLLLTDVMGATPCNVARQLLGSVQARLVAGVNLPMLLRAVTYQHEPIDELTARAVSGGSQGVMQVAASA
ncbi:MAG: PTS fructose transporter subunit IIA, partial [Burkholderiales bacterium]|nr:PTS fructose transporter subunit IIA [Burkholderiales bacterium]